MPLWLALLLIAVAAVLICEVIAALKPPHPTLDLADRETRALRGVWRCRLLAGLAVIISWACSPRNPPRGISGHSESLVAERMPTVLIPLRSSGSREGSLVPCRNQDPALGHEQERSGPLGHQPPALRTTLRYAASR